ncbi:MAG TPA: alpha/beta hydrolase [Steroidobacteraceae bacterium]|nr:alpha/beta hydrolase [Steroidobacteraceae bacterium]
MRTIALALGAVLLACGCSQKQDAAPPPAASPAANSGPAEGAPRIVVAPDGVHVQYHVYGSGEPALVFIHGWSCDSNYWRAQVPAFKQHYTVVTVDLAGHGGTDSNRTDWTIEHFGGDVAAAMAAVPSRQIILVGHSMGGPVAIEAARKLGKRVIGIIGVDTFNTVGAPAPTQAQIDAIIKPMEADFIGQTRKLVTEHLFHPGGNRELANKVAYDMSLSPPRIAIPALRAVLEYDFTEPLKDLAVPVVAIDSDLGEPVNEARIRKVLPKFHAVTLTGVGHFLMMEDPAKFNAALATEVQGIRDAAGS